MIDSYSVRMNNLEKQKNKFEQMGFVKFWLVSFISLSRPLSNKRIYTSAYKRLYSNINNYFHLFNDNNIFVV